MAINRKKTGRPGNLSPKAGVFRGAVSSPRPWPMSERECQATELEADRLLETVNAASGTARNSWIFFLALTAFFFITVAGTHHKNLLLNLPVSLPILQTSVTLKQFFFFAPFIYLLVHFGVLLQHVLLARKLKALDMVLRKLEAGRGTGFVGTDIRRLSLGTYFFVQSMAGPRRSYLLNLPLSVMSSLTLGLLPALLFVFFLTTFLPYHSEAMSWVHRLYLVADSLLLLVMGIFLRFPDLGFRAGLRAVFRQRGFKFVVTLAVWGVFLGIAFFAAMVPDGWWEKKAASEQVPVCSGSGFKSRAGKWKTGLFFNGDPV